jgi:hypothetical protein
MHDSRGRRGTLSYVDISTQVSNNVLNVRDAIVILAQVTGAMCSWCSQCRWVPRSWVRSDFLVVGDSFYDDGVTSASDPLRRSSTYTSPANSTRAGSPQALKNGTNIRPIVAQPDSVSEVAVDWNRR